MADSFTVANLINDNVRVNPEARAALIAFKRAKPWQGTIDERRGKFLTVIEALAAAYGFDVPDLRLVLIDSGVQSGAAYSADSNVLVLAGKLSVVSLLHCIAKARGKNTRECFAWSLSVFKRFFPISFGRCQQVGPYLVRGGESTARFDMEIERHRQRRQRPQFPAEQQDDPPAE